MPWQGPAFTARVLLLTRNPRLDPAVHAELADPDLALLYRAQLSGLAPFPWLDPRWSRTSGARYWGGPLRHVAGEVGEAAIVSAFATVQYGAYWSTTWPKDVGRLTSQGFTAAVVQAALRRGAVIVIGRAEEDWRRLVPDLADARTQPKVVIMTYPWFRPALTPGRLGEAGFARVCENLVPAPFRTHPGAVRDQRRRRAPSETTADASMAPTWADGPSQSRRPQRSGRGRVGRP